MTLQANANNVTATAMAERRYLTSLAEEEKCSNAEQRFYFVVT